MKKIILFAAFTLMSSITLMADYHRLPPYRNLTEDIPLIDVQNKNWTQIPDVAQYGDGDWSHAIGRAQNVTVKEAMEIAESNPEITFFFHMKGNQMVLGNFPDVRVFRQGDAIFFSGDPWWGSAEGYADGYIKKSTIEE